MGYRSEVIIAMNTSYYKKNKEVVDKLLKDIDHIQDNIDVMFFCYHSVKWYEDYPDVKAIEEFIRASDEEACLVRLGEEFGDFEHIGNHWDFDIYPNHSISVPEPRFDTVAKKVLFKKENK